MRDFVEVGTAMKLLLERRAYLERGYATFDDYTQAMWGFSRQYGYRLITAVETVAALTVANGDTDDPLLPPPANEAQARALAPLRDRPHLLGEVWRQAVETAPEGKVTAQHVARVVEAVARADDEAAATRDEAWSQRERRVRAQKAGREAALARRHAEQMAVVRDREADRAAQDAAHGGPSGVVAFEVAVDLRGAPAAPPAPTEYRFTVEEERHPDGTVAAEADWTWEAQGPIERLLYATCEVAQRIEDMVDYHGWTSRPTLTSVFQLQHDARREAALAARGPWVATLTEAEAVQLVSLLAQAHDRIAEAVDLIDTIRGRSTAEEDTG
jgi:hypothetical protein